MTAGSEAKAAAEAALARGAHPHQVDGGRTPDKAGALDAIAEAMSFPSYFGRNLDALYDLLTDLSWLPAGEHVLIWTGSERLRGAEPQAYLAIRSVLSDAQRALAADATLGARRLTVVLAAS
ncbi:barstar family protein [Amycolatopsis sp. PS_44_ISF1]|uniref:barstar family protein n=1 Tax=Amycolatopsis sp. PS_44_ISF1 TaxID=2974917 RepID=UPI0028DECE53|nr:barstar family protein [Amycolatopsis sp. PS_44_ISF1]MDT8914591.1 barstar family protein [Amycolatopsis sp. PS_44_ISF1]